MQIQPHYLRSTPPIELGLSHENNVRASRLIDSCVGAVAGPSLVISAPVMLSSVALSAGLSLAKDVLRAGDGSMDMVDMATMMGTDSLLGVGAGVAAIVSTLAMPLTVPVACVVGALCPHWLPIGRTGWVGFDSVTQAQDFSKAAAPRAATSPMSVPVTQTSVNVPAWPQVVPRPSSPQYPAPVPCLAPPPQYPEPLEASSPQYPEPQVPYLRPYN